MAAQMRAARLHEPGQPMRIDRVDRPQPRPGDVVVQVKACGIIPNMPSSNSDTLATTQEVRVSIERPAIGRVSVRDASIASASMSCVVKRVPGRSALMESPDRKADGLGRSEDVVLLCRVRGGK